MATETVRDMTSNLASLPLPIVPYGDCSLPVASVTWLPSESQFRCARQLWHHQDWAKVWLLSECHYRRVNLILNMLFGTCQIWRHLGTCQKCHYSQIVSMGGHTCSPVFDHMDSMHPEWACRLGKTPKGLIWMPPRRRRRQWASKCKGGGRGGQRLNQWAGPQVYVRARVWRDVHEKMSKTTMQTIVSSWQYVLNSFYLAVLPFNVGLGT